MCPGSCDALEGPRVWGQVQDGAVQGQNWSFSRGINICLWLSLQSGGAGELQHGTQGCSPPRSMAEPWQCLLLQLLGFSLASPAAPRAKHNTSPSLWLSAVSAAFWVQPPKEGSSASSQEQLRDPHRSSIPPAQLQAHPKTTLPRLMHVWGWHSCSLAALWGAAVGGIHPSQRKLLLGTHLGHGRGSRSW